MNIVDAFKSGKSIKRPDWDHFVTIEDIDGLIFEAMIADDWEIEEKVIPLTKTKVIEAWSKALKKWGAKMEYSNGSITTIEELLKELGFQE
jgi:hypothetical protein